MSPLAAHNLEGFRLSDGWNVTERVVYDPSKHTGGHFSVGYHVESDDGQQGFLKALDISDAANNADPARVLSAITSAFNFERDLLYHCESKRMDKIVVPIIDGSVDVPGFAFPRVQYLIFQRAKGDSRSFLEIIQPFDLAWRLRSLHDIAIGLRQLHSGGIAHQDLKPSNILIFDGINSKISDLGCACPKDISSPRGDIEIAGDTSYAPPELLYGHIDSDWSKRRIACDLYTLGSLVQFFFTKTSMTHAIMSKLHISFHPENWTGDYLSVTPFVVDAWNNVCEDFEITVSKNFSPEIANEITLILRFLTNPVVAQRGHQKNLRTMNQFSMERFVSFFDRYAKKAELRMLK